MFRSPAGLEQLLARNVYIGQSRTELNLTGRPELFPVSDDGASTIGSAIGVLL